LAASGSELVYRTICTTFVKIIVITIAYTDFTLSDLEEKFGLKNERSTLLFLPQPMPPSEKLHTEHKESNAMPIKSEKTNQP
jgi:hypothetical protein